MKLSAVQLQSEMTLKVFSFARKHKKTQEMSFSKCCLDLQMNLFSLSLLGLLMWDMNSLLWQGC